MRVVGDHYKLRPSLYGKSDVDNIGVCVSGKGSGLGLLLRLLFPPVHHIYSFLASRYGGIEPMDIVGREHIVGHIALVDIYV